MDAPDKIKLLSPNGSEDLIAGELHEIEWSSLLIENLNIEYSLNNGGNWITIASGIPASSYAYTWTVPETPSNKCLLRIIDSADVSISDQSDGLFSISLPRHVKIEEPNGSERLIIDESYDITWTSAKVDSVQIDYSVDGGSNWIIIIESVISNGSYTWTVPNTPSFECLFKITDTQDVSINDVSDSLFTITGIAKIQVLSPNGDEELVKGATKSITWSYSFVGNVTIEFSDNNGENWETIIESTPSDGYFLWTVPDIISSDCLIRITDVSNPEITDLSDSEFSIIEDSGDIPIITDRIWTTYTGNALTNIINDIAIEGDKIWCATDNGIVVWNKYTGEYTHYTKDDGLVYNLVKSVAVDLNGIKWCTTGEGISRFDGTTWESYRYIGTLHTSNFPDDFRIVNCVTVDSDNRKWFGGEYGLAIYDDEKWDFFTYYDILGQQGIEDIEIAKDNIIWLAPTGSHSSKYGVLSYDSNEWILYQHGDGLAGFYAVDIAIDADNTKWFATRKRQSYDYGIDAVSSLDTHWTTYTTSDGLVSDTVNAITVDTNNIKWFGTYKGVSSFDGNQWHTYTEYDGLLDNYVISVKAGKNGEVYFGTSKGLSYFNGSDWTNYQVTEGLIYDSIYRMAIDNNGVTWIVPGSRYGTTSHIGIQSYDGYAWKYYTKENGLSDDKVNDVEIDDENNVLGSNK